MGYNAGCCHLGKGKIAGEGLAQHVKADVHAFHLYIRPGRKGERNDLAAHVKLLAHGCSTGIHGQRETAGKINTRYCKGNGPAQCSGKTGAGNHKHPPTAGQAENVGGTRGQIEAHIGRRQLDDLFAGNRCQLLKGKISAERLTHNPQAHPLAGYPHKRPSPDIQADGFVADDKNVVHRRARGIDFKGKRSRKIHIGDVLGDGCRYIAGHTRAGGDKQGPAALGNADQIRGTVAKGQAHVIGTNAKRAGHVSVGDLVKGKIAGQLLTHDIQLGIKNLEARNLLTGIKGNRNPLSRGSGNGQGFIYRRTRGIDPDRGGSADGNTADPDEGNRSPGNHGIRIGDLDQTDGGIGENNPGGHGIDIPVSKSRRPLAHENHQPVPGKYAPVPAGVKSNIPLYGDEVRDIQGKIRQGHRKQVSFCFTEPDHDGPTVYVDGLIHCPAGLVDAQNDLSTGVKSAQ